MSGESAKHTFLVETLINFINAKHNEGNLVLFADHQKFPGAQPLRIGLFKPDVYAHLVPATFRILGEAKTADDLISKRTQLQLSAFLDHLSLYNGSTLYLATTWLAASRADDVIKSVRLARHSKVETRVILS